ncbi:hypothetical protein M436DRAFT_72543 [Aureobasidium namibiae CBS 147.97]|uniref:Uncharacterized protein n=1 Tax=Aureobasidium namibiae CBS 147.97 TaxID=1043004 RepID=A0A074WJ98_9PEZI
MSDSESSGGADTPSATSTLADSTDRPYRNTDLNARLEVTYDVRPSLRDRRRVVDITDRQAHLTPDVIRDGGDEEWLRYYWTTISLVVPGERTLVDPRQTLQPDGVFHTVTENWSCANFNAALFIDAFFDPRHAMPEYMINNRQFQRWLYQWRRAAMQATHTADETALHSIPTRHELAAYRNLRERHNFNHEVRFFSETQVTYEILIMWDFNSTAPEGEITLPRVSVHNIRFLFDVFDAFPRELTNLLVTKFVFKDVRAGRYTHDASSKRYFDNDSRLGRAWKLIIRDTLRQVRTLRDNVIAAGNEDDDTEESLQAKSDLAYQVQRQIQRTWTGEEKLFNRGQLKFFMFDAFKESRRLRRMDEDVRRWLMLV